MKTKKIVLVTIIVIIIFTAVYFIKINSSNEEGLFDNNPYTGTSFESDDQRNVAIEEDKINTKVGYEKTSATLNDKSKYHLKSIQLNNETRSMDKNTIVYLYISPNESYAVGYDYVNGEVKQKAGSLKNDNLSPYYPEYINSSYPDIPEKLIGVGIEGALKIFYESEVFKNFEKGHKELVANGYTMYENAPYANGNEFMILYGNSSNGGKYIVFSINIDNSSVSVFQDKL